MIRRDLVVTVREDEQGTEPVHSPPQEPDRLERGMVRPVRILHDREDRLRRPGQLVEDRLEKFRQVTRAGQVREHVPERPERARRHEVIAQAPPHVGVGGSGERPHQRGLADARIPGDEHDTALTGNASRCAASSAASCVCRSSSVTSGRLPTDMGRILPG